MSNPNNIDFKNGKNTTNVGDSENRKRYVKNVKTEMIFFNFGLPSNPKYVNLDWKDVIPKIKALQELWVRLNVYMANGKKQAGIIKYPEADRVIEYNVDSENINRSYVRFYSTRNDLGLAGVLIEK